MWRIALGTAVLAAIAACYGLARHHAHGSEDANTGRRLLYYVDPMHPAYTSDHPGVAPDCGMRLEPVYAGAGQNSAPDPASSRTPAVSIDSATRQLFGIQVAAVEKTAATRVIRAIGRVAPEDTRIFRINSGVDGFIRATYNDSVGTRVKKDQKLAAYYGPEFLAAASGFLAATQRVPGAVGQDGARFTPQFPGAIAKEGVKSIQGYSDRLRNLGMSDAQITRMAETRQLPESIDIVAPANGFILARNVSPGLHFEHGAEFYRIADLSRVWVVAEVSEQDQRRLRPGASATIRFREGGRPLSARVTDSLPQSEAGGETVKLRLEADNPGVLLRPDMLVDIELPLRLPPAITVPLDALVDSGATTRVYVERSEGVFEAREVETGWRFGDRVEILRGLRPGDRVVAAATFLVDSESRLKGSNLGAAPVPQAPKATTDPKCGMPVDPAKAASAGNIVTDGPTTYYFCSNKCKKAFLDRRPLVANAAQGLNDD